MTKRKLHLSCFAVLIYLLSTNINLYAQPDGIKISQPWILGSSFQKGLFKTSMVIYGNELSGLMVMKKTGKSLRVVFMSEIGLKYFDVEVNVDDPDSFAVHHMPDMLKRKPVLKFVEDTFRMLVIRLGNVRKEFSSDCEGSAEKIMVIKTGRGKFRIYYHLNSGKVSEVIRGGFMAKTLSLKATEYDFRGPAMITAQQKNMNITLQQIKNWPSF